MLISLARNHGISRVTKNNCTQIQSKFGVGAESKVGKPIK